MAAVIGAFIQSLLTVAFYVVVAGLGIFAGRKLLARKKEQAEN